MLHATQGPAGTWSGCHFGSVSLSSGASKEHPLLRPGRESAPVCSRIGPCSQQDQPPCAVGSTPICCVLPILPSLPRQSCCLQTPSDSPCCPQLSPNSISQSFSGLNGKTHPHPHPWGLIPGKPSGGTTFQRYHCTCRAQGRFSTEVFPGFPPFCHQKHPNNQHPWLHTVPAAPGIPRSCSHCSCPTNHELSANLGWDKSHLGQQQLKPITASMPGTQGKGKQLYYP